MEAACTSETSATSPSSRIARCNNPRTEHVTTAKAQTPSNYEWRSDGHAIWGELHDESAKMSSLDARIAPWSINKTLLTLATRGLYSTGLWRFGSLGKCPEHREKHDFQNGLWELGVLLGGVSVEGCAICLVPVHNVSLLLCRSSWKERKSAFAFVTLATKLYWSWLKSCPRCYQSYCLRIIIYIYHDIFFKFL
jgi:hypothetical protein